MDLYLHVIWYTISLYNGNFLSGHIFATTILDVAIYANY